MEIATITELITTLGFPIAMVIGMAWFIYQIYKKTTESSAAREEKLYQEIEKNRIINEKAINTIALYAEKLEVIQTDIHDIKNDIVIITEKIG